MTGRRWANTRRRAIRSGTGLCGRRTEPEGRRGVVCYPAQQPRSKAANASIGGNMTSRFFTAICLFTVFVAIGNAQLATTTSLVGNIYDPTGKAIENAKVTAVETGTADTRSTT